MHDWEGIADRARTEFPELWTATRNDLCFATTNRQAALQAIAAEADAIVVIGSANSSNTFALAKVADRRRVPDRAARRRPRRARRPTRWATPSVVGVTAGASAPEDLVQAVIARLAPTEGVVPVHVTDEDEYFPPPRELRELMSTLDVAAPVLFGGRPLPTAELPAVRPEARSPTTAGSTPPTSWPADAQRARRSASSKQACSDVCSCSVRSFAALRRARPSSAGGCERLPHRHRDPVDAREHLALREDVLAARRCPPARSARRTSR